MQKNLKAKLEKFSREQLLELLEELKEFSESEYWLELLLESGYYSDKQFLINVLR